MTEDTPVTEIKKGDYYQMKKSLDACRERLHVYRETERTGNQLTEIVSRLGCQLAVIAVSYWVFILAINGAKVVYAADGLGSYVPVATLGVFLVASLWGILWFVNAVMYISRPIRGDFGIWFDAFAERFKAASSAWGKAIEK